VREVATRYRNAPWPEVGSAEPGELPAPRLARAVLVVTLCGIAVLYPLFVAENDLGVPGGYSTQVVAWTIAVAVAFIHVTTAGTAWLSVALGIAFIALGLRAAPWLLRRYGALAQSLLPPTRSTKPQNN
jgi:hypothetical protein